MILSTKNYHLKIAYKSLLLTDFENFKIWTFRFRENISFLFSQFLGINLKQGPSPLTNNFSMSVQNNTVPKSPVLILLILHQCLKPSGKYVQSDTNVMNCMIHCHSEFVFFL
jgi:hypothetical protein